VQPSQTPESQTAIPAPVLILPDPITDEIEGFTVTISFSRPPDAARRAEQLRLTTAEALRRQP